MCLNRTRRAGPGATRELTEPGVFGSSMGQAPIEPTCRFSQGKNAARPQAQSVIVPGPADAQWSVSGALWAILAMRLLPLLHPPSPTSRAGVFTRAQLAPGAHTYAQQGDRRPRRWETSASRPPPGTSGFLGFLFRPGHHAPWDAPHSPHSPRQHLLSTEGRSPSAEAAFPTEVTSERQKSW